MKNEYILSPSSLVHFSGIALSTVFNFIITVMEISHFSIFFLINSWYFMVFYKM